jgi:hypothetical protein
MTNFNLLSSNVLQWTEDNQEIGQLKWPVSTPWCEPGSKRNIITSCKPWRLIDHLVLLQAILFLWSSLCPSRRDINYKSQVWQRHNPPWSSRLPFQTLDCCAPSLLPSSYLFHFFILVGHAVVVLEVGVRVPGGSCRADRFWARIVSAQRQRVTEWQ